jgi:hypothetical protein
MEWYIAAKLALQSIFDEKFKKIVLLMTSVIVGLSVMIFSLVSLPSITLNLPATFLQPKEEVDKVTQVYTDIMVEYKRKIHSELFAQKRMYIENGLDVEKVKANYPSLSLLVAYDNVINYEKYKVDNSTVILNKDKAFTYLDSCMEYKLEGSTIVSYSKSVEEIAKINFTNEEERNMFNSMYTSLKNTDLDNTVPDVKITDLEYLEGGIELPYFNQNDKRWKFKPYGISTVGKSGCGITSMTMILDGLVPDLNLIPPEVAKWSADRGHYVPGAGTAWSLFPALAKEYNLNIKNLSRGNPQEILNELSKGHPVLVSMSAGHFTRGAHLIVLRGVTDDGKIIVSDPASLNRSKQTWDFSIILTESSRKSSYCFWAFSNK